MKQRRTIAPKERAKMSQQEDRVERARKRFIRFDRHGGYLDACAELARETGGDAASMFEEWEFAVTTSLYSGTIEVEDAEIEALRFIQERFRRAS